MSERECEWASCTKGLGFYFVMVISIWGFCSFLLLNENMNEKSSQWVQRLERESERSNMLIVEGYGSANVYEILKRQNINAIICWEACEIDENVEDCDWCFLYNIAIF